MPEEALRYKLARNVSSPWAPCKRDGDKQAKVHRKGVGVVESGNSDLGSNWKWRCFVWRREDSDRICVSKCRKGWQAAPGARSGTSGWSAPHNNRSNC